MWCRYYPTLFADNIAKCMLMPNDNSHFSSEKRIKQRIQFLSHDFECAQRKMTCNCTDSLRVTLFFFYFFFKSYQKNLSNIYREWCHLHKILYQYLLRFACSCMQIKRLFWYIFHCCYWSKMFASQFQIIHYYYRCEFMPADATNSDAHKIHFSLLFRYVLRTLFSLPLHPNRMKMACEFFA